LLIDPSGNEHFIKPREGNGFCFACTAAALHCLQTNAPEGGRGHFTGLRGGGPLTTLVLPPQDNLWETIWINVLSREDFLSNGMPDRPTEESDIFPWLAPSRSGEKKSGQPTLPEDCHPLQVYWSIPRRIRIDFSCLEKGSCDICRTQSENLVQRFIARPYGVSYEGPWQHPLTPYSFDQKGVPFARKAREGSISYRNWVGLVLTGSGDDNAKVQYRPARVVEKFSQVRKRVLGKRTTARLWGFGYDMEHKRARCWFDGRMPLPAIPDERIAARYSLHSERMVKGANIIASNLRQSLKEAFFRYTEQARGDTRFVDTPFYTVSEPLFFEHLEKLIRELEESESERPTRALSAWHRKLCDLALKLFDDYVNSSPIEDQDPSRIARARNKLKYRNRGNTVRAILGLPQEPQERQEPVSS
jgi:CRISPR system Cascade subunit CasA